jgi:hypothetical protein
MAMLFGRLRHACCIGAVEVFDFSAAFPDLAIEFIAENGVEPGAEVGALGEALAILPGLHQGFLDQVIRAV